MAKHTQAMIDLAMICRRSHGASIAAVGWLLAGRHPGEIDELLEYVQEYAADEARTQHYPAYLERWGRTPDRP